MSGGEKRPRGFALLSPERRREISSMGGKAGHASGSAHEWTAEEARTNGRKGGLAFHAKRAAAKEQTP